MVPGELSATLAAHVAEFPAEHLPPATRHAARRALLDGVGVMLGASGASDETAPFIALAAEVPGRCRVLGTGFRSTAALAALANGAMAHALDFEDAFDAAPSHPDASLLPAALAVADERGDVTGAELLAAIAIGCDLVCRLALSLRRPMEAGGWYPPPILGAFGAAAAAARLRRLDARQTLDCFSLMLCQVSTPGEIKHSRDTVIRAVREAFPAQAAVQASALAAAGVRGFEAPFEGAGGFFRLFADGQFAAGDITDRLGERFWIEQLSFKRWPACRGTHAYIEAAQTLRARYGFAAAEVASIVATGGEVQRMLAEPPARKAAPATAIDAKFSIPFTVAVALLDDEVTLDSFDPAALADPVRRALAARVRFVEAPDWAHGRGAAGVLAVSLTDGRVLHQSVEVAAGDVSRPLDDAALTAKFVACAGRARVALPAERAEQLAAAIWSIDGAVPIDLPHLG